MITPDVLTEYIHKSLPDAVVTVTDRTGTMDHLKVVIVSDGFGEESLGPSSDDLSSLGCPDEGWTHPCAGIDCPHQR